MNKGLRSGWLVLIHLLLTPTAYKLRSSNWVTIQCKRTRRHKGWSAKVATARARMGDEDNAASHVYRGTRGFAGKWEAFSTDKAVENTADLEMRKEQLMGWLDQSLATLRPRERFVLKLRFGLGNGRSRTLEEVGEVFGLTRQRVSQIQSEAVEKLRKLRHQLEDFLLN